jgi:hypothetical protein
MSTEGDESNVKNSSETSTDQYAIREVRLGIWKAFIATQKRTTVGTWREIRQICLLIIRLVTDIYKVSPRLFSLLLLSRCWNGVQSALAMRLENIILRQVGNTNCRHLYMLNVFRSDGDEEGSMRHNVEGHPPTSFRHNTTRRAPRSSSSPFHATQQRGGSPLGEGIHSKHTNNL